MSEPRKYRGVRYTAVINKNIAKKLEAMAEAESRSVSQMIGVLIGEAIKAREAMGLLPLESPEDDSNSQVK